MLQELGREAAEGELVIELGVAAGKLFAGKLFSGNRRHGLFGKEQRGSGKEG